VNGIIEWIIAQWNGLNHSLVHHWAGAINPGEPHTITRRGRTRCEEAYQKSDQRTIRFCLSQVSREVPAGCQEQAFTACLQQDNMPLFYYTEATQSYRAVFVVWALWRSCRVRFSFCYQLRVSVEHRKWISINALPPNEACCFIKLRLMWVAHTYNRGPQYPRFKPRFTQGSEPSALPVRYPAIPAEGLFSKRFPNTPTQRMLLYRCAVSAVTPQCQVLSYEFDWLCLLSRSPSNRAVNIDPVEEFHLNLPILPCRVTVKFESLGEPRDQMRAEYTIYASVYNPIQSCLSVTLFVPGKTTP